MKVLSHPNLCLIPALIFNLIIMNILIWNYRGALNPSFQRVIRDMVRPHLPTIMVITETKVSRDRAKGIADRLPIDGASFANSIGLFGGLWVLWDSNQVAVTELSSTEQEIHLLVTPNVSQSTWLLSVVYANPRVAERRLLWDNLCLVSNLHSLPWVIAGDFNEVLICEDKFGGRPINIVELSSFKIAWIIVK